MRGFNKWLLKKQTDVAKLVCMCVCVGGGGVTVNFVHPGCQFP
jgi:hypothetical protein